MGREETIIGEERDNNEGEKQMRRGNGEDEG